MSSASERREELKAVWEQARACRRCPQLASTRTTVVFGSGNADADLMFVGEAPGANEDSKASRSSARRAACSTSCSPRSA